MWILISLLKIWNLNKCTGVLGVFNCQGAGIWPCSKSNAQGDPSSELSVKVSPTDIEYFEEVSGNLWTGDCAVFSSNTGSFIFPNNIFIHTTHTILSFLRLEITNTVCSYRDRTISHQSVYFLYICYNFRVFAAITKGRKVWCHIESSAMWCLYCISN